MDRKLTVITKDGVNHAYSIQNLMWTSDTLGTSPTYRLQINGTSTSSAIALTLRSSSSQSQLAHLFDSITRSLGQLNVTLVIYPEVQSFSGGSLSVELSAHPHHLQLS